jgi:TPR repeat protein
VRSFLLSIIALLFAVPQSAMAEAVVSPPPPMLRGPSDPAPAMPMPDLPIPSTIPADPPTELDPARFGEPVKPPPSLDPSRFGERVPDQAFGAFQRGLYKTAYNLALPRAESGDPAAQTLVAEILSRGLGMRRDDKSAALWYQRAAEQGVPEAQFQYALMLLDGKFVRRDVKGAYALMQAAAEAGNRLAQFNLAQLMIDRNESMGKAVDYYQRAAEAGLADAQYAMAQVYLNGAGGRKMDVAEARKWLTLSARQNYDTAQLDLGTWLTEGRGGIKDEKDGFAWLKRAAEGGNIAAQNRLAKLYMNGIGTDPDSLAAAAWYILARRSGLIDPIMDDFMNGLTEEEQKTALERANRLR